jgi:hypothetical protein
VGDRKNKSKSEQMLVDPLPQTHDALTAHLQPHAEVLAWRHTTTTMMRGKLVISHGLEEGQLTRQNKAAGKIDGKSQDGVDCSLPTA